MAEFHDNDDEEESTPIRKWTMFHINSPSTSVENVPKVAFNLTTHHAKKSVQPVKDWLDASYSTRLHEWIYLGIHIPSRSDTSQYGDICALLKNSPSRLRGRPESRVIFSTHRIDKILAQSQLKYKASLNTRPTF